METAVYSDQKYQEPISPPSLIMKVVSLISWLLLVVTSLVSFVKPEFSDTDSSYGEIFSFSQIFWLSVSMKIDGKTSYGPVVVFHGFFCFCFYSLIAFNCLSCGIMFYNTFFNIEAIKGMFERFSKFHFIPLLCTSALFIIGETLKIEIEQSGYTIIGRLKSLDAVFWLNLVFTFIGMLSLLFIQLNTDLSPSRALQLVIKQGTYGILMALLVYNFYFSIYFYGNQKDFIEDKDKFASDCNLAFSILIGVCNLALTFFLKNIGTGLTNLFLYIGMIIWFFKMPEETRKKYNGLAEGIIDCVVVAINLGILVFLFIRNRKEIII